MSVPRVLAVVGLLVLAVLALPLLASVLDGRGTENFILPVHLLLMAVLGAVVWRAVPAPATSGAPASRNRTLLIGAVVGVAAAVFGLLVFFLVLSGLSGA